MTTGDPTPDAAHPHLPSASHGPGRDDQRGTDQRRDDHGQAEPDETTPDWPAAEPLGPTGDDSTPVPVLDGPGATGPAVDDGTIEDPDSRAPVIDAEAEGLDPAPVTTTAEGITADLWAFRFADPIMAQEALLAAMRLQRRNRLQLDDAAIVVRDERGRTRIIQTTEISTGQGAISGSWLGLLAGMFVPGPGALVGLALGAAAGGLFAKLRDKGINDDEMKQWGEQLGNGESALFLLVEDCHQMRALHEVSRFPATILTATADPDLVERVRERLPVDPWGP